MSSRIALMVRVTRDPPHRHTAMQIVDVESEQPINVAPFAFVLTLEAEPQESFARGHLRFLLDDVPHKIHTDRELFDTLANYVGVGGSSR